MNYKLSEILKAQEILSTIDKEQLSIILNDNITKFVEIIESFDLINNTELQNQYNQLNETVLSANKTINQLIEKLKVFEDKLAIEQKLSHQNTLKSVNDISSWHLIWQNDEDYLQHRKQWNVSPGVLGEVISLLGKYASWKYPVVYYEPHTADLLRYLISGDPFYVIDDHELPHHNILESVPEGTAKKVYLYTKSQAEEFLEKNSVGLCVSWQNIPFKKLGEVRKDIEIMANVTRPGGYVIFDYVNAGVSSVAKEIEEGKFMFQWRDRIVQFLNENNLEILHEIDFIDYSPNLLVCQKAGQLEELIISNKVGVVLETSNISK